MSGYATFSIKGDNVSVYSKWIDTIADCNWSNR